MRLSNLVSAYSLISQNGVLVWFHYVVGVLLWYEILNDLFSIFSVHRPKQHWRVVMKTSSMALFTFILMEGMCWCWKLIWTKKIGRMLEVLNWGLFSTKQSLQALNQYSSSSCAKCFHRGRKIRILVNRGAELCSVINI